MSDSSTENVLLCLLNCTSELRLKMEKVTKRELSGNLEHTSDEYARWPAQQPASGSYLCLEVAQ